MYRFNRTIGHRAPYIIGAILLIAVLLAPIGLSQISLLIVAAILIFSLIYTWKKMRLHDRSLCGNCIKDMPEFPFQRAEDKWRKLKMVHAPLSFFVKYFAFILLVDVVLCVFTNPFTYAAYVVVNLSLLYLLDAHVVHRVLQPWCRRCQSGGVEQVAHDKVVS